MIVGRVAGAMLQEGRAPRGVGSLLRHCWTERIVAVRQSPDGTAYDDAACDPDGDGRVEYRSRRRGGCSRRYISSSFSVVLRLRIVPRGLLAFRQGGRPRGIADSQIPFSRRNLYPAIHVPDFEFGPDIRYRRDYNLARPRGQQSRGRNRYPSVLQLQGGPLVLNQRLVQNHHAGTGGIDVRDGVRVGLHQVARKQSRRSRDAIAIDERGSMTVKHGSR